MAIEVPSPSELQNARKEALLSQGDLAEMTDLSQGMISRIENDDVDPRLSTVRKIAEAIDNASP